MSSPSAGLCSIGGEGKQTELSLGVAQKSAACDPWANGSPGGFTVELEAARSGSAMPSSRSHDVCWSVLEALTDALADAGSSAMAGAWASSLFVSRNVDDLRCRPGEQTSVELSAVSPAARRDLRGRPGWRGALVTHRAPVWEQRAHGAVLFWARRHCTRLALQWSQAERLTAGLGMLVSIRGAREDRIRARVGFLLKETREIQCDTTRLRLR